jgi:hypothetical protein
MVYPCNGIYSPMNSEDIKLIDKYLHVHLEDTSSEKAEDRQQELGRRGKGSYGVTSSRAPT